MNFSKIFLGIIHNLKEEKVKLINNILDLIY